SPNKEPIESQKLSSEAEAVPPGTAAAPGRAAVRSGYTAIIVPITMTSPPIQSHRTKGLINTLKSPRSSVLGWSIFLILVLRWTTRHQDGSHQDPISPNPAFDNDIDTRLKHVRLDPFVLHGQTCLPFSNVKGQRQMAHIPLDRVGRHRSGDPY